MFKKIAKIFSNQLSLRNLGIKPDFPRDFSHRRRYFTVSVTTRCNFNCPHCLWREVDEGKTLIRDVPISALESALKNGKKLNFQMVSFTGGEPILNPQFEELVSLAVKYKYKFNFASNGWLYKEYAEIIKKYKENLEWVFLSLDSVTPEIHDAVHHKPGSFVKVLEAINFYRQEGIPIAANFCAIKKNFHQIEKLPDFCLKLGVKAIRWIAAIPVAEEFNIAQGELLTDKERAEAVEKILNLREKFKFRCGFHLTMTFFPSYFRKADGRFWICRVLNCNSLHIDHDGGMFFCCGINRQCQNKPLIQKIGFEKALAITLDTAKEMKKRFLITWLNKPEEINHFCDFCNKNIESCLVTALKKQ